MKYNEKYDRWATKDGLIYRYDSKKDKLILCKLTPNIDGYLVLMLKKPKSTNVRVHRIIYETFIGEIPDGYEIDHVDTHKDNNSLDNLKLVTHTENMNNCLTLKHISKSLKGNTNAKGKPTSEFGRKFKEHYGITRYQNTKLYDKELHWYRYNGKCSWE
jgi:hypothetical protein